MNNQFIAPIFINGFLKFPKYIYKVLFCQHSRLKIVLLNIHLNKKKLSFQFTKFYDVSSDVSCDTFFLL